MKTIFILLCSIISCLGQAFTWHDLALVESQNAGAAFQPSDVANLIMWYKADAITASVGDLIGTWNDSSSSGYNLRQTDANYQPYYTNNVSRLGGKPWIQFPGPTNFLDHANATIYNQPNTIFALLRSENIAATMEFYTGTNNSYVNYVFCNSSTRFGFAAGSVINCAANGVANNVWYLTECTFNGASSDFKTNAATLVTGDANTKGLRGFRIGCNEFKQFHLTNCGIAEIIIYNADVSAGDRTSIRNYFTTKYGPYSSW